MSESEPLEFAVEFVGGTRASGSRNAQSLCDALSREASGVRAERVRQSQEEQNLGDVLHIVLNSAAVVVLAKAVWVWAAKNRGVDFKIKDGNFELTANNIRSEDATKIASKLLEWAASKEHR